MSVIFLSGLVKQIWCKKQSIHSHPMAIELIGVYDFKIYSFMISYSLHIKIRFVKLSGWSCDYPLFYIFLF